MTVNLLMLQALNRICQAIASCVKIRVVYLARIAGKHFFATFSRPADNGFDLMGRNVLPRNGTSPDITERLEFNGFVLREFNLYTSRNVVSVLRTVQPFSPTTTIFSSRTPPQPGR